MGALDQPANPAVTTDAGSNPGVQEVYAPGAPPVGGYTTIGVPTVYAPAAVMDTSGITFTGNTCDASGNCLNPSEVQVPTEQFQQASIVEASSSAEANLVIGKDAEGNVTHTWNKPVDASNNYQLAVFVDNSVKENPAQVLEHLNLAKSELEKNQKVTFQVPETLPSYMTANSNSDEQNNAKDKQAGDPDDQAPSGKGGGGGRNGPCPKPADDDPAEQEKAEEARKAAEEEEQAANGPDATKVNDKTAGQKTLASEVSKQLNSKENGGINPAYMSRLANQVYNNSPMYSFISNHMTDFDKNDDGIIDEDEMKDGMDKYKDDPDFQKAQADHANRVGDNPDLAELNTAKGMAGLYNLNKAGESATSEQVNKAFSPSTQNAISNLVVSQEIKNAGLDPSTSLPQSAQEQAALFDEKNGKLNDVLYKLLNAKEKLKS